MTRGRTRLPGWVVVVAMFAFIAAMGVAIYFGVRTDPTLPKAPIEKVEPK
ncbi:MAG: hypothetical protein R3F56_26285 [Planctomycetota bacterium]